MRFLRFRGEIHHVPQQRSNDDIWGPGDLWRDVDGTHISLGSLVELVGEDIPRGVLQFRLAQRGLSGRGALARRARG
jgi:hypothetical protein